MALVTLPTTLLGERSGAEPDRSAVAEPLPSRRPAAALPVAAAAAAPAVSGPAPAGAGLGEPPAVWPPAEPLLTPGARRAAPGTAAPGPNGIANGHATAHAAGLADGPRSATPAPTAVPGPVHAEPGSPSFSGGRPTSSDGGEAFTYYDVDEDPPGTEGLPARPAVTPEAAPSPPAPTAPRLPPCTWRPPPRPPPSR